MYVKLYSYKKCEVIGSQIFTKNKQIIVLFCFKFTMHTFYDTSLPINCNFNTLCVKNR